MSTPSVFQDLSDICDDLECAVLGMDPSPARYTLEAILIRLDAVIDRTVGMEEATHDDKSNT